MENILETKIKKIIKTILISLYYCKYDEFSKYNKQIKKDIELIIYLKTYLGINTSDDTFKKIFNNIKENLEIV
jgi:hypothetical protein